MRLTRQDGADRWLQCEAAAVSRNDVGELFADKASERPVAALRPLVRALEQGVELASSDVASTAEVAAVNEVPKRCIVQLLTRNDEL